MPLPLNITELLHGKAVEWERLEFKRGRARPRRYRNRRIGDFLKELDITEGRGTGIPKILKAMAANGSPPPVFEFDDDHSYFMVRLPVHAEAVGKDLGVPRKLGAESGVELGAESRLESRLELRLELRLESGLAAKVFLRLLSGDSSKAELAAAVGHKTVSGELNKRVAALLQMSLIERTIPDRPNSRNQRYRLTPAGRELLEKLKTGND